MKNKLLAVFAVLIDAAKLGPYPAGSFIIVPADIPHFVAAKEGNVIVQVSGNGKFGTNDIEK